jgi:hypothetical protein
MLHREPTQAEIESAEADGVCSVCEVILIDFVDARYTPWHAHYECYEKIHGPYVDPRKAVDDSLSRMSDSIAHLEDILKGLKK